MFPQAEVNSRQYVTLDVPVEPHEGSRGANLYWPEREDALNCKHGLDWKDTNSRAVVHATDVKLVNGTRSTQEPLHGVLCQTVGRSGPVCANL